MDIALHRVSSLTADAEEYPSSKECLAFTTLKIDVRTERGEQAEIRLYASIGAPFAEIAAAINAAYAVSAAQKEEAA